MAEEKKVLKFQMMMAPSEAALLDDWMFKKRLKSRAEAIRRLCQIGIAFDKGSRSLYSNLAASSASGAELLDAKQDMWSGAKPVDLDRLGTLIDRLVAADISAFEDMLEISKAQITPVAETEDDD